MSGNSISLSLFRFDAISRKTIRYAMGVGIAVAVAFGFNWPLSFLAIVLANSFLMGSKPSFKVGFGFVLIITIAVFTGILLSNLLLAYKFIYLMVIGVVLLYLYYADQSTLSPILKLFLIIFTLVIPLISLQSVAMGTVVGVAFIFGGIVSLFITWFLFFLLPDLEVENPVTKAESKPKPPALTVNERIITAIKSLAVVYPLIVLYYFFDWQNSALILIYVGMYSTFPGFAKDFSKGKGLLASCITGGVIAFLIYEIVVIVPVLSFFVMLFFGLSLWIGNEILTGGKYGGLLKAGFSTIVVILGSAVGSDEVDAGGEIFSRVIQISIVVIYMVLAFGLIEKLFPPKSENKFQLSPSERGAEEGD